jgi:hypothetical protein
LGLRVRRLEGWRVGEMGHKAESKRQKAKREESNVKCRM